MMMMMVMMRSWWWDHDDDCKSGATSGLDVNCKSSCSYVLIVFNIILIELDDGKIYRKPLYLMVKTMVSCRFSLKPIHWYSIKFWDSKFKTHANFIGRRVARPASQHSARQNVTCLFASRTDILPWGGFGNQMTIQTIPEFLGYCRSLLPFQKVWGLRWRKVKARQERSCEISTKMRLISQLLRKVDVVLPFDPLSPHGFRLPSHGRKKL